LVFVALDDIYISGYQFRIVPKNAQNPQNCRQNLPKLRQKMLGFLCHYVIMQLVKNPNGRHNSIYACQVKGGSKNESID